ncbi:cbb3-type cytochrome c oxidase subunit II [Opitutaceae bacterium]
MNRFCLIFLGIFAIAAVSWSSLVFSNQRAYGAITAHYDENEGKAFPQPAPGLAQRGKLVYQDLGCAACHTQQVRRPGFGSDQARGWGERQSVARDYLYEGRVLLGSMRLGPDLRNVGARQEAPSWYLQHLYDPKLVNPESTMPSYKFLFETRQIVGEPSAKALTLPASHAPAAGYEVVPSDRAQALAYYLATLKDAYEYPETSNVYVEKASTEGEQK